jgi:site-specific recombinase XerD
MGGKRVRESSGAQSKRLAEEILRQREAEALLSPTSSIIYRRKDANQAIYEYLEWIKVNKRFHTLRSYRTVLGLFQEYLQEHTEIKCLIDITPKTLEDYKDHRLALSKTNTVKNHIIVLKAFFNKAVEWRYLQESPAKGLKSVEITDAKPIRYLTEEEYQRFMEICRTKFTKYYPMFYTFVHTGMRRGELMSLEWDDIDLRKGFIHIRSKEGFKPKGIDHKTGKAKERVLPIHEGVFDQHNRPRRILQKIAKIAGIKGLTRLHELRHSYATFLVKKGVNIYKIKELLGHSDIKDTVKYAHLPAEYMKEDVDLLKALDEKFEKE